MQINETARAVNEQPAPKRYIQIQNPNQTGIAEWYAAPLFAYEENGGIMRLKFRFNGILCVFGMS